MSENAPPKAEYVAAVLIDYAEKNAKKGGLRRPVEELAHLGLSHCNIKFAEIDIEDAIDILVELEIAEIISVGESRPYFLISAANFQKSAYSGWYGSTISYRLDSLEVLAAFRKLGSTWLDENLRQVFQQEISDEQKRQADVFAQLFSGIQREAAERSAENELIPASDRVVSIDHNDPLVIKIRESALDLSNQLLTSNDLGKLTREDADAASAEIGLLASTFNARQVRARTTYDRAKNTLTWVGEHAAGGIIGSAALALLALIASFFGFSF